MKIKQRLYITEPENFLNGDYMTCLNLFDMGNSTPDSWIDCGEIELNISVKRDDVAGKMLIALDNEAERIKQEAAEKLEQIAAKRSELLAIESDGEQ